MTEAELLNRIANDDRDKDAWRQLALHLAAADPARALALFEARHARRGDLLDFGHDVALDLADHKRTEDLRRLYDATNADSPLRAFLGFGLALALAPDGDLTAVSRLLREAAHMGAHTLGQVFTPTPEAQTILGTLLQQAYLVEPMDWEAPPAPRLTLNLPTRSLDGPLVLACCDEAYFIAYGQRFLDTLSAVRPGTAILLHIIGPNDDGNGLRDQLSRAHPNLLFSFEDGLLTPAIAASRRFQIAQAVRVFYDTDLILSDVDSAFGENLPRLLAAAEKAPLALIGRPLQLAPSLLFSAAFVWLRRGSPVATRFLAEAARYLGAKLADPFCPWTVDQAALYRAYHRCGDDRAQVLDLAREWPDPLAGLVGPHLLVEAHRKAMRGRAFTSVAFDADRRPIFS
ncbi:hypothetical protein JCM17960_11830 [Magnetospira thiophila]